MSRIVSLIVEAELTPSRFAEIGRPPVRIDAAMVAPSRS